MPHEPLGSILATAVEPRVLAVDRRRHVPPDSEIRDVFGAGASGPAVVEPVTHVVVASATAGIWRVRVGPRSAIVKVLAHAPDGRGNWQSGDAVDHWYYWRREAAAYESGVLGSLAGGLRAPECYLVAERDDASVAIWLEDLRGAPGAIWPVERYQAASRQLGEAQGEFVAGRPVPPDPWLSRDWLRAYLHQRDGDLALLEDPAAWRHPLVAAWFPDPPVDELVAMRRDQPRFLAVLDGLPRTLAHLDLHPANLFAAGRDTAVVDWAFVGVGALGEDPGNLVPDAALDFHVSPDRLDDLDATVTAGYLDGLRAAGWDGTADLVRLAMATTMAAKYAWIAPAILRATSEGRDQLNRRPTAEAVAAWAPTVHFLLARAREAAELAGERS